MNKKLSSLLATEEDWLANLSNTAALIYHNLPQINWAGFYLYHQKESELVLGPFQGLPACVRIKIGNGVCGTAFQAEKTILVKDVHKFPGHIACDPASSSEIVIPLKIDDQKIMGVLDIDSPVKARFNRIDQKYLEKAAEILLQNTNIKPFIQENY
ncbi:MAG: GAF domain-containing protein [Halanaerobiaceae bacterium]